VLKIFAVYQKTVSGNETNVAIPSDLLN